MSSDSSQRVLTLQSVTSAGSQLSVRYGYGNYRFSQSFWYDFNLNTLDEIYGAHFMEKVYFHIASFSAFQLCTFVPDVIDWGPHARWHTAEFERVWKTTLKKLSGQWRYEHSLTQWKPPRFASRPSASSKTNPITIRPDKDAPNVLAFFGGGKDSTIVLEFLRKAGISFSSLTYSHNLYGRSSLQHDTNGKLLEFLPSSPILGQHHKLCIFDDFLDSPVLESLGKELGIHSFTEGEGPCSLFASVPIMLFHRYTAIVIGNERSANVGNLVWADGSGEEINHQWGKSKESELLLGKYLQEALASNLCYLSLLQPIHDVVIFSIAQSYLDVIVRTHSCNMSLSWCKRCPKCCYVWLSFMAYLPCNLINDMFQSENLFDAVENEVFFSQMIGLGIKKPFDCIGEIDEAKLAFELCRRKGLEGHAMEIYKERVQVTLTETELARIVDKYTTVYTEDSSHVQPGIWAQLLPILKQAAEDARKNLETVLS